MRSRHARRVPRAVRAQPRSALLCEECRAHGLQPFLLLAPALPADQPAVHDEIVTVDERRRVIEWRLPSHEWPARPLVLTAIDAHTGEFVTWDSASGVSLVDAVASSCAVPGVWPCVPVGGRTYYDGGLRTSTNAHLAAGHDTVVIIAPLSQGVTPLIEHEIEELRAGGATVSFITTDDEAKTAMGVNALDPAYRRVSAEHGLRQGLDAVVVL